MPSELVHRQAHVCARTAHGDDTTRLGICGGQGRGSTEPLACTPHKRQTPGNQRQTKALLQTIQAMEARGRDPGQLLNQNTAGFFLSLKGHAGEI